MHRRKIGVVCSPSTILNDEIRCPVTFIYALLLLISSQVFRLSFISFIGFFSLVPFLFLALSYPAPDLLFILVAMDAVKFLCKKTVDDLVVLCSVFAGAAVVRDTACNDTTSRSKFFSVKVTRSSSTYSKSLGWFVRTCEWPAVVEGRWALLAS